MRAFWATALRTELKRSLMRFWSSDDAVAAGVSSFVSALIYANKSKQRDVWKCLPPSSVKCLSFNPTNKGTPRIHEMTPTHTCTEALRLHMNSICIVLLSCFPLFYLTSRPATKHKFIGPMIKSLKAFCIVFFGQGFNVSTGKAPGTFSVEKTQNNIVW